MPRCAWLIPAVLVALSPGCRQARETPPPAPRSPGPATQPALATRAAPHPEPTSARSGGPGPWFRGLAKMADDVERADWHALAKAMVKASLEGLAAPARDGSFCLARGDAALAEADVSGACRLFRRAMELEPAKLDAVRGLSVALVAGGQYAQAVPLYQALLARDERDAAALFNLAVAYTRLSQWDQAEAAYRRLLAERPDEVRGWYNLAGVLQTRGKLSEARDTWRKVVALDPSLPEAHACLGEVLMDLASPAEAMDAYTQAAKLAPQVADHWANLATASRAAGELGRAGAALNRALALAPKDAALWRELGSVKLEIHRLTKDSSVLAEAVQAWRESLALKADQPDVAQWVKTYASAAPASGAVSQPAIGGGAGGG